MDYKAEAERIIELFGVAQFEKGDIKYDKQLAKACAAICVKEIIKEYRFLENLQNANVKSDYWNKVLEHINQNQ